jgi:hypothetical protein
MAQLFPIAGQSSRDISVTILNFSMHFKVRMYLFTWYLFTYDFSRNPWLGNTPSDRWETERDHEEEKSCRAGEWTPLAKILYSDPCGIIRRRCRLDNTGAVISHARTLESHWDSGKSPRHFQCVGRLHATMVPVTVYCSGTDLTVMKSLSLLYDLIQRWAVGFMWEL